MSRTFGISTRLFREERLTRDHLVHIAAHDFEAIELYADPAHFDTGDAVAIDQLAEWLADTRLQLHAVHSPDGSAITLAQRLTFPLLVMHRPSAHTERALVAVTAAAAPHNVKVALEVRGESDSSPEALVTLIEDELEDVNGVGICLDLGRAHILGDLGDAIETVSGHLLTTHVHDNGGKRNDHLLPYAGTIHWESAMMEMQKVGYDGAFIFELAPAADPVPILVKAAKARERLEKAFITF